MQGRSADINTDIQKETLLQDSIQAEREREIKQIEDAMDLYGEAFQLLMNVQGVMAQVASKKLEGVDRLAPLMKRYALDAETAQLFDTLKVAMKKELDYKGFSGQMLTEFSDQITKDNLIAIGDKAGLSEEQVVKVLPAMAMKVTASETKFMLSAFKSGLFSKPRDLGAALHEVEDKYTQRFGLK